MWQTSPEIVEASTRIKNSSQRPVSFHTLAKEPERFQRFVREVVQDPTGGTMVVGMQHIFTQAFFFSATTATGRSVVHAPQRTWTGGKWTPGLDFLGHVETFEQDWRELEGKLR